MDPRKGKTLSRSIDVILSLLLCVGGLSAQSTLGSVVVSALDSSAAAVQSVDLTLYDADRNVSVRATSNFLGLYEFVNLLPSRYELTAVKPGMHEIRRSFELKARQAIRIDVTLLIAPRKDSVDVFAAVPLLNTSDGAISDTKNFEQVSRLPLNYRASNNGVFALEAVSAVPGVSTDDYSVNNILNGSFVSQRSYTIDGVVTMNVRFNGP